jgi:hypothetical protein
MTCSMILVMGLGPRFHVSFSYNSPLCVLHFQVWFFVWISVVSLFFSSSFPSVFFICLFIYNLFTMVSTFNQTLA